MKKIIMTTLIVVGATILMSFMLIKNNTEKEISTTEIEIIKEGGIALDRELVDLDGCWWDETFNGNFTGKRGVSCGSDTSLKIWFTNPYSYTIRVAFYFRDTYGNYGMYAPYVEKARPGQTIYHHKCHSNGQYIILAARADDYCSFPKLD